MKKSEVIVFKRQQFLYSFIKHIEKCTATDLQKLVFLYLLNTELDYYSFMPYKFGSYSYQLAEDVTILKNKGFISLDPIKANDYDAYLQIIHSKVDELRGTNLIKKVYLDYPYYAINSEIAKNILSNDEIEIIEEEKNKFRIDDPLLLTIGYEGKTIEQFANNLIKNNIHVLCDVRNNPLSRKLGFSKQKMTHILNNLGIKYVHIPELGILSNSRKSLDTKEDYKKLFKEYKGTLKDKEKYLDIIRKLYTNNRVALMCFEKDPEYCHRQIIKDYLVENDNLIGMDL
jgi:uncharacterized protein (DUF488 family)